MTANDGRTFIILVRNGTVVYVHAELLGHNLLIETHAQVSLTQAAMFSQCCPSRNWQFAVTALCLHSCNSLGQRRQRYTQTMGRNGKPQTILT